MGKKKQTKVESFIASLRSASQSEACEMANRCIREGRTHDLVDLWRAIKATCNLEGRERFPYPAVADHIEDLLATNAGDANVDALFALLAEMDVGTAVRPRSSQYRLRDIASRLGFRQSKDSLLAALTRFADDDAYRELLACWLHEAVLRGHSLERDEAAQAFRASLISLDHPLAGLPLARLDTERDAASRLVAYGAHAIPDPEAQSSPAVRPRSPDILPRAIRIEAHDVEHRIREAVLPWTNASIEAKIFRIEPSIAGTTPGFWLLRALSLDCLANAESIRTDLASPGAAWLDLLSAASGGGAYTSGLGGAYSRLAAWASLAALVDAAPDETPSEIEARTQDCSFLRFFASGAWFHDVAWDLGILTVRKGGETVAVLAASDTD